MEEMEDMLSRINELARKSKTPEGLTEEEKAEQKELRQQYVKSFRGSLNEILLHSTVLDPEGTDVTPEKLRKAQEEMNIKNAREIVAKEKITFLQPDLANQEDEKEQNDE